MLDFKGHELLWFGAFLAVWAVLWIAAAISFASLRRRLFRHEGPLDAPTVLDAYDLAYLAGRMGRVRDAALVRMIAGGHLHLQWESSSRRDASKQNAAKGPPSVRADLFPVQQQSVRATRELPYGLLALHEPKKSEAGASPASGVVKSFRGLHLQLVVDRPLPSDAHPVESKLYEILGGRPAPWVQACHEPLRKLEKVFQDRLGRQDLLRSPVSVARWAPPPLIFALTLTWCIVAMAFFSIHSPPGNTDPTGKTRLIFIVSALCLVSCFFLPAILAPVRHLNRRGHHFLAEALCAFQSAPVAWSSLSAAELGKAVALAGVAGLPPVSPWTELKTLLYPPPPPSSNA